MKWFDRWFYKKAKWAWENREDIESSGLIPVSKRRGQPIAVEEDSSWVDGLRIGIKKVIGGKIVSFRTYDRKTDRSEERHYIITDEQDFNTELGKMITLESMRQT